MTNSGSLANHILRYGEMTGISSAFSINGLGEILKYEKKFIFEVIKLGLCVSYASYSHEPIEAPLLWAIMGGAER